MGLFRGEHDFDWVTARHAISTREHFELFLTDVSANVETRNAQIAEKDGSANDNPWVAAPLDEIVNGFKEINL